jgi:hypothetical protein
MVIFIFLAILLDSMKQQNTTNIEGIISYLCQKKEYYEKILELTPAQEKAIKSNNTKDLHLIVIEKENCIKDIKHLEKLNTKIQEDIISNRKHLILDNRINSLLRQLQSIIKKVRDYDLDSLNLLSSSIDSTKTKINNLNKKRRTRMPIRKHGLFPPRFVDVIQ